MRDVRAIVALNEIEKAEFLGGDGVARLRALLPAARWFDPTGGESWPAVWSAVRPEVLISGWGTPPVPADATGLRYVGHLTGTVRHLVPRRMIADGLVVTNWGPIAAPMVAEHALLLILGALRSAPHWPRVLDTAMTLEDKLSLRTRTLFDRRVAVHGFGGVARELVRLLAPFRVTVTAFSPGVPEAVYREHGVRSAASLEALAKDADVFACCEALTPATRGSLNGAVLSRLPAGAVFVNVGRGAVVNEADLARAAADRGLRVALDVFTDEPMPTDAPLRTIGDAWMSPHIGGPTHDVHPRCGEAALRRLEQYLTGESPDDVVTPDAYDRST